MDNQAIELFLQILKQHLKYWKSAEELDLDQDLQLLGLDSMAAVDLLFNIEEAFNITLPDKYLVGDTFSTARTLWTVVNSLKNVMIS